ncbi:hypothetical protein [Clostridioides sp. ES-S-0108-01]
MNNIVSVLDENYRYNRKLTDYSGYVCIVELKVRKKYSFLKSILNQID